MHGRNLISAVGGIRLMSSVYVSPNVWSPVVDSDVVLSVSSDVWSPVEDSYVVLSAYPDNWSPVVATSF